MHVEEALYFLGFVMADAIGDTEEDLYRASVDLSIDLRLPHYTNYC